VGSAIYAHWRAGSVRALITVGAALLGAGFVVMAAAPSLAVAMIGGAIAGGGNGIWAVAARTALQEQVEPKWMAMMMSLNESLFQALPGLGIVIGGGLTALAGSRAALAVAGGGAVAIAIIGWPLLHGLRAPAPVPVVAALAEREQTPSSPTPTR
jgi:MFS family permease